MADPVQDQAQQLTYPARAPLAITNLPSSQQKLAQTFTVGLTGDIVYVRLPVACESGELILEIAEQDAAGLPNGAPLATVTKPASDLPPPLAAFQTIDLSPSLSVNAGDRLAIRLRNETGSCSIMDSPDGDLYPRGTAYFDARPNPPGWRPLGGPDTVGRGIDLPFQVFMDHVSTPPPPPPGEPLCEFFDGSSLPGITVSTPICFCLRDQILAELRCAFIDPDLFAIRRIPWPIPLAGSYAETWEVLPLTAIKGPVRIELKGANISKPVNLSFSAKSRKAVETRKAVLKAPKTPATMPGSALITIGERAYEIDTTIPADQFADPQKIKE